VRAAPRVEKVWQRLVPALRTSARQRPLRWTMDALLYHSGISEGLNWSDTA